MADKPDPQNSQPPRISLWKLWPIITVGGAVLLTAGGAQVQIGYNDRDIVRLTADIQARVPTFLYEKEIQRIDRDIIRVADQAEGNEAVIDKVEDSTDRIESQIELEVERLRNQLERSEAEQAIKLDNILRLLETQPAAASRSMPHN